jgi:hypothetical protein
VADPDKAEAEPYVAKVKADFAVELKRRREVEAKKEKPPIELAKRLANPEKPTRDWLTVVTPGFGGGAGSAGEGEKPEIQINAARLADAASEAMRVLAARKVPIFQRDGALVQALPEPGRDSEGNRIENTVLVRLEQKPLKWLLYEHVKFYQKSKEGTKREVGPGNEIAQMILGARGKWPFKHLTGLLAAPTIRHDGSLLLKNGFDEASGLLLLNVPEVRINPKPTRAEAETALATLKDLLSEVDFVDDPSHAVALSLILSTILGGALETTPLHLLTSPTAGSGKSFVVDIASLIATGERCGVVAATKSIEEQEKRIATAMASGRALVSLDNLNGELASDLLCQAMTQPIVLLRRMGVLAEIKITSRSTYTANGNNITIADDLVRRTLLAQIDTKMEKPWDKKFSRKPLEMIARDRAKYIEAALTIPLAYMAAGLPDPPELNGFGQWSRLVRGPLMWLGEADPAETMQAAREGDARLQAKATALSAIADLFGLGQDRARTAAQMIEATDPFSGAVVLKELLRTPLVPEAKQKALREALMAVAAAGKEISAAKLGQWLRRAKGQIVNGYCLQGEPDRTRMMHWWIEKSADHD